jgi:hypothetical protein
MNKINTNIIFILTLMLIIGCDKDPSKPGYQSKPPKPEFHDMSMSEDLKSYLWSKPGSYWIYKNTKTGDLDTQVCTGFLFNNITIKGDESHSKHITIKYDLIARNISSTYTKHGFYDETTRYYPNSTPFKGMFYALYRHGNGSLISVFHYPFNYLEKSGTGSTITSFIEMDSTLSIQDKTFHHVAKFEIDRDNLWYPRDFTPIELKYPRAIYFWAKDVGLVKRENKNENYSWELIEYNIIK